MFELDHPSEIVPKLADVLMKQYIVTLAPEGLKAGEWHELHIKTVVKHVEIAAPTGFLAPKQEPDTATK